MAGMPAAAALKHTKSNAIALATGESTVGIGMGQTNRISRQANSIAVISAAVGLRAVTTPLP